MVNTILEATDIHTLPGYQETREMYRFAREVEAAVLAKLAQQPPDIEPDEAFELGLERIAYYTHPAPTKFDVLMVTTAYEQGVGKGHQARQRGAEIGNPYADGPCREAWGLGYEEGKSQADRQRVPDEPDWRHPRIQALIGADARNRICIDLVWRILEDPNREFTAGDMEYWDKLHDKVQEVALAAAPELLEALELLTAGIESSVSDTYIPLVKARAAIAKATGEKA